MNLAVFFFIFGLIKNKKTTFSLLIISLLVESHRNKYRSCPCRSCLTPVVKFISHHSNEHKLTKIRDKIDSMQGKSIIMRIRYYLKGRLYLKKTCVYPLALSLSQEWLVIIISKRKTFFLQQLFKENFIYFQAKLGNIFAHVQSHSSINPATAVFNLS